MGYPAAVPASVSSGWGREKPGGLVMAPAGGSSNTAIAPSSAEKRRGRGVGAVSIMEIGASGVGRHDRGAPGAGERATETPRRSPLRA